jgi:uncharacterized membrane protein YkvA (DUF1232 family)
MNKAFDKAKRKAVSTLNHPRKKNKLVDAASRIASSGKYALHLSGITGKTTTLIRMVRCTASREYQGTPWKSMVLITAALIYFVSPFDAIADFLPLIGFIDDAAVISVVFASISKDVEKFIAWEARKSPSCTATISPPEFE